MTLEQGLGDVVGWRGRGYVTAQGLGGVAGDWVAGQGLGGGAARGARRARRRFARRHVSGEGAVPGRQWAEQAQHAQQGRAGAAGAARQSRRSRRSAP